MPEADLVNTLGDLARLLCATCAAYDGQHMDPAMQALAAGGSLSLSALWASELYRRGQMDHDRDVTDPEPPPRTEAWAEWDNRQKWDRWIRSANGVIWVDYGPDKHVYYGVGGDPVAEIPRGQFWSYDASEPEP